MYAVNSSVPKTLVKHLVRYEGNKTGGETRAVLEEILNTEISPELLPPDKEGKIVQKTEDIVGPYELHDFYLYHAIRCGETPKKVYYLANYAFAGKYDKVVLLKWLKNFYRRFFSQQFKRSCIPDGVKIGSVTLSPPARIGGCLRTPPRRCGWRNWNRWTENGKGARFLKKSESSGTDTRKIARKRKERAFV